MRIVSRTVQCGSLSSAAAVAFGDGAIAPGAVLGGRVGPVAVGQEAEVFGPTANEEVRRDDTEHENEHAERGEASAKVGRGDEGEHDEWHDAHRATQADQHDAHRAAAIANEPVGDGDDDGDVNNADDEGAAETKVEVELPDLIHRGEQEQEGAGERHRSGEEVATAIAVHEAANNDRREGAQQGTHRERERDRRAAPAEFVLQRADEYAEDGIKEGDARERDEGHRADYPPAGKDAAVLDDARHACTSWGRGTVLHRRV